MPNTCWAPGCKSGYPSDPGPQKHFFKVPKDSERLILWRRKIPREGMLKPSHFLCDLHFEDQFILKKYVHIIKGVRVETDRGKWQLTSDAVPTIFPNLPKYLTQKMPKSRHRKPRTNGLQDTGPGLSQRVPVSEPELDVSAPVLPNAAVSEQDHTMSEDSPAITQCSNCRERLFLQCEKYQLMRRVNRQFNRIKDLTAEVKKLKAENNQMKQALPSYDKLPSKIKQIVDHAMQNTSAKSKTGYRYTTDWLLDALLIRCKSTRAYKFLRNNGYLPLPSISTLNRSIKTLRPEFGFDRALSAGLSEKLKSFPVAERRGMLMFDELQISKNIDFRVDTGKIVGMVDFGDLTTAEHMRQEGDHALVFLFQPHRGGWMQTIGSFCSLGTTPTFILSKLIVQAIILLENCGALVDGIVCDGATTNRAALGTFGFNGQKGTVNNKMVNPCAENRHIYFFCDTPHLLKTIRNNLLKAKEFKVFANVLWMCLYMNTPNEINFA